MSKVSPESESRFRRTWNLSLSFLKKNYPPFLLGFILALSSLFSLISYRQRKSDEVFSVSGSSILGGKAGSVSAVATSASDLDSSVVEATEVPSQTPRVTDKANNQTIKSESLTAVYPININSANLAILDLLPGIGPALAQRIVDFRQTHGGFTSVEQLLDVSGIGEKKLEKIRDLVTVGN